MVRSRAGAQSDEGVTLTELMVTMFVISFVLLGLIGVQVHALGTVGLSKQRQQATALANRTMEQLRALPYDTVAAGLLTSDAAADTQNVANVGGVLHFQPAYDPSVSERLQTTTSQSQAPLYPHIQQNAGTTVGNIAYRVGTYVSRVDPTQDIGFNLTVLVDWSSAVTNGDTKSVVVRSRLFSPTGCAANSTAVRPFAGPCQAFHYSDAGAAAAGISVVSTTDGNPLMVDGDVTALESSLPSLSVRTQNEQVVSTQSVVSTSQARILSTSGNQVTGGQSNTSAADIDPATGLGNSPTSESPVGFSGVSTLSRTGSYGTFSVQVPGSASGSTYSTTAAAASPPCRDIAGVGLVTNQACSTSHISPDGTYAARMNFKLPSRDLGTFPLAEISTLGTAQTWRAFGARAELPVSGHCAAASGVGCVAAGADRTLGAVTVGALPGAAAGDLLPASFAGMVTLDGLSAQASAEAGIGAGTSAAIRGGNLLRFWDGTGYTDVTLDSAGGSHSLGGVTAEYRAAGSKVATIKLSGTVTVDPSTSASTGSSPCESEACSVTSTVGAVRVSVEYEISDATGVIGRFVVNTDLGNTIAQATYKAAPSA